nr:ribonuclease H-like domain-containing protein [Tanacetum cinerariifolium]
FEALDKRQMGEDFIISIIDEYLQNEHYALWEVIEFGDSSKAPPEETGKGPRSESSIKKRGRTILITTEDMQKRRNDVKARTTLLLALPDEHQLGFSKYETAQELWEAILKTFGGNEATKKTKKNQLKQQYGNFKAEDDLNQKFLTSLAPEWLMYTIVWRYRDDLDTMSLDDVYNHLKVYETEVQKKSESNSQNMAFISSSNTNSRKGKVHTTSIPTASIQVSTVSTDVAAVSLSHDTVCAYIASQSNGSQIKYEDITQIDEDDIEEMDIKWNMTLLSMKADRFWKKTSKKITIQGSDVASSDKLKVEARLVEFKEHEIKFCEKIRGLERDVEVTNNKIEYLKNELEQVKKEKEGLDNKLTGPHLLSSKCNSSDLQSRNFSVSNHEESSDSIMSKHMMKFVKVANCPEDIKTNKTKTARKSPIKYAEMYRNVSKSPKVRGK